LPADRADLSAVLFHRVLSLLPADEVGKGDSKGRASTAGSSLPTPFLVP